MTTDLSNLIETETCSYFGSSKQQGKTTLEKIVNCFGTKDFLPIEKLDGVAPVDNRPSTDYLYHFVQKRKRKKGHVACDR